MSEAVERDCPLCQGRGWNEVTVAEHACGGDAERCAQMCPQPAQGQEECEFCLGTGKLTVGAAGGGAPSGPSAETWAFADLAEETAAALRKHFDAVGLGEMQKLRLSRGHWHLIVLALERAASRSAGSEEPK